MRPVSATYWNSNRTASVKVMFSFPARHKPHFEFVIQTDVQRGPNYASSKIECVMQFSITFALHRILADNASFKNDLRALHRDRFKR